MIFFCRCGCRFGLNSKTPMKNQRKSHPATKSFKPTTPFTRPPLSAMLRPTAAGFCCSVSPFGIQRTERPLLSPKDHLLEHHLKFFRIGRKGRLFLGVLHLQGFSILLLGNYSVTLFWGFYTSQFQYLLIFFEDSTLFWYSVYNVFPAPASSTLGLWFGCSSLVGFCEFWNVPPPHNSTPGFVGLSMRHFKCLAYGSGRFFWCSHRMALVCFCSLLASVCFFNCFFRRSFSLPASPLPRLPGAFPLGFACQDFTCSPSYSVPRPVFSSWFSERLAVHWPSGALGFSGAVHFPSRKYLGKAIRTILSKTLQTCQLPATSI